MFDSAPWQDCRPNYHSLAYYGVEHRGTQPKVVMANEIGIPSIVFGPPTRGVSLAVISRAHPHATDYWDGNWINTAITIQVGGFRAKVVADLRSEEIADFCHQLKALYDGREGIANFRTMEEWLSLDLSMNRHGQSDCRYTARSTGDRQHAHLQPGN